VAEKEQPLRARLEDERRLTEELGREVAMVRRQLNDVSDHVFRRRLAELQGVIERQAEELRQRDLEIGYLKRTPPMRLYLALAHSPLGSMYRRAKRRRMRS
jgi:hypothetical protein